MLSLHSSDSSLNQYCSQLKLHHKRALVESTLLSLLCTLPLDHFFSEDPIALSFITTFRSADLASSYAHTIHTPKEEATKRSIIYHMTKIKYLATDQLLDRGFEQALTPDMIAEIVESSHSSSIDPFCSSTQEIPRSPSESSDDSTPVPIPTPSQLAMWSLGNPRHARGKKRATVAFGVGISRPITPSPAPIPTIISDEDKPVISSSNSCAPSEETFRDRNGVDYSTMMCWYCGQEGHLTTHCQTLKGHCIIQARPGTWAFHHQLKIYKDKKDLEQEEYEKQYVHDTSYDPKVYYNLEV
ncbi:hypothetical protein DFJ58DRAFT_721834 [Suillus subalutaceus]|uniref:uncharacterized protein n=1 Tax=Suillus subalutaceus TaxID=48586 RepID=UPI001B8777F4|nr:uncharacterized protein DFJ58DRAFT_721834 [Suillus subalutaceus]KAG1873552.1 hypothetical protein DFJ58DRAFT_721834 [Suillus subalutaceus]